MIDYSTLLKEIQKKIENSGFNYFPAHRWFNLEIGEIPSAQLNNGFSVRISEQNESEYTDHWLSLLLEVEFVLDGRNDRYAEQLGKCNEAVLSIRSVEQDNIKLKGDGIQAEARFNYIGEIVIVTYDKIFIEIG